MLSAHYDSYFDGFQDDNTAIAMMLCIGKTLLQIGYQPENTLTFCAMAAEEWGISDTQFDWSTGAYEQVFTVHPEWRGSVIADLNFELPALAHGTRARIRSTYEYVPFLEEFLKDLPTLTRAYPEETRVTAPIETWSDDFPLRFQVFPPWWMISRAAASCRPIIIPSLTTTVTTTKMCTGCITNCSDCF